jgi:hypothetical protein
MSQTWRESHAGSIFVRLYAVRQDDCCAKALCERPAQKFAAFAVAQQRELWMGKYDYATDDLNDRTRPLHSGHDQFRH